MKKLLITSSLLIASFATAGVIAYNSVNMPEETKENVIFTAEAKEATITSIETVETPSVNEVVEPVQVVEEQPVSEEPVVETPSEEPTVERDFAREITRKSFVVRNTN